MIFDIKGKHLELIEKKLEEITKQEKILFMKKPLKEINNDRSDRKNWAVGIYSTLTLKKDTIFDFNTTLWSAKYLQDDSTIRKICLASDWAASDIVWTWMHELGHHFNGDNEDDADNWVYYFFENYMPYYFLWLYKISIEVHSKIKYKINLFKMVKSYYKHNKLNNFLTFISQVLLIGGWNEIK